MLNNFFAAILITCLMIPMEFGLLSTSSLSSPRRAIWSSLCRSWIIRELTRINGQPTSTLVEDAAPQFPPEIRKALGPLLRRHRKVTVSSLTSRMVEPDVLDLLPQTFLPQSTMDSLTRDWTRHKEELDTAFSKETRAHFPRTPASAIAIFNHLEGLDSRWKSGKIAKTPRDRWEAVLASTSVALTYIGYGLSAAVLGAFAVFSAGGGDLTHLVGSSAAFGAALGAAVFALRAGWFLWRREKLAASAYAAFIVFGIAALTVLLTSRSG